MMSTCRLQPPAPVYSFAAFAAFRAFVKACFVSTYMEKVSKPGSPPRGVTLTVESLI